MLSAQVSELLAIAKGSYVAPKDATMTFDAWAEKWLAAYSKSRRQSSARQAKTHLKTIREAFGPMAPAEIKPSMVATWTGNLKDHYKPSTVYALYRRLTHVLDDAVHDGLLARNPCSRRTALPTGHVEQFCPATEEVWPNTYKLRCCLERPLACECLKPWRCGSRTWTSHEALCSRKCNGPRAEAGWHR
jgi:Phage integrase SAM-like domain